MDPKLVVPFMAMPDTVALTGAGEVMQEVYDGALKEARETDRMTLKERLLRFSFVAHVVSFFNRHGIEMGILILREF